MDFWRRAFSSSELFDAVNVVEGRRGCERERICARRKAVFRSRIVGVLDVMFVVVWCVAVRIRGRGLDSARVSE